MNHRGLSKLKSGTHHRRADSEGYIFTGRCLREKVKGTNTVPAEDKACGRMQRGESCSGFGGIHVDLCVTSWWACVWRKGGRIHCRERQRLDDEEPWVQPKRIHFILKTRRRHLRIIAGVWHGQCETQAEPWEMNDKCLFPGWLTHQLNGWMHYEYMKKWMNEGVNHQLCHLQVIVEEQYYNTETQSRDCIFSAGNMKSGDIPMR